MPKRGPRSVTCLQILPRESGPPITTCGAYKQAVLTYISQTKKQWRVPRRGDSPKTIEPGDSGVWVTCSKGKEGKCVGEILDLFTEYAERLYPQAPDEEDQNGAEADDDEDDIEKAIKAEVNDIRKPAAARLFTPVRINVQCGGYCHMSNAVGLHL